MVDARAGLTAADLAIAEQLPARVERITLYNKSDLAGHVGYRENRDGRIAIWLSAKTGEGMALESELLRVAGWQAGSEDVFLARERHLLALQSALTHLADCSDSAGSAGAARRRVAAGPG